MAGQFSDTGSRYALEALTGRQSLALTANQYTISSALTNGLAINAAAAATGLTLAGQQTLTFSTTPTGFIPGASFVISGNATTAANGVFTVTGVNYTTNQVQYAYTGTAPTASGSVYVLPQAKTTYIALCTAQPLDNNYYSTTSAPSTLQIQEYAATGYSRQAITWSASVEPNPGVYNTTASGASGQNVITVTSNPGVIAVGQTVYVPGAANLTTTPATTVTAVSGTSITLSQNVATTLTSTAVRFVGGIFVGTGATINTVSTTGPIFSQSNTTSITSVSSIAFNGSSGNPPYIATVTYTSQQAVAVGQKFTLNNATPGTSWTGGTGLGSATTQTYTVLATPTTNTFTFSTNSTLAGDYTGSSAAVGTFTPGSGGTIVFPGPLNATYTTYSATTGGATANGVPVITAHNLVVGSTVNIKGGVSATGTYDVQNATVVAVPTTTTFTIAVENTATAGTQTTASVTASSTTVYPGSYFVSGATAIPATGFTTYVVANSFVPGDTVIITGNTASAASPAYGYNRITQVFAANSSQVVVFDDTTGGTQAGTVVITKVPAVNVGGLIQGPATGSLTFGAFTANTGATITHAALVSTQTANSTVATSGITVGSGSASTTTLGAGYALVRTQAAHGLQAGHQVYLTGFAAATWNGLYTVVSLDSNGTPTTGFWIQNATASTNTSPGTVTGIYNGELLAWWALDTPRTPATNDQVTIGTNQLSLYVN
jgi:hypothetical protein